MTRFINTRPGPVFVSDPEFQHDETSVSGLLKVAAESEFSASGRLAEEAERTGGIVKANSDAGKEFTREPKGGKNPQPGGTLWRRSLQRSVSGPDVFPVPEEDRAERSGLHITGRDSGVPVAAEEEPGDTKDGSGKDKFKGVAAVEDGEVVRGDVPKAVKEEPSAEEPGDVTKLTAKQLRALLKQRDVSIPKGSKKPDLVALAQAPRGAGGGGGVAVQTEGASQTEKSEAVGPKGGTLTTADDPSTGSGVGKPLNKG